MGFIKIGDDLLVNTLQQSITKDGVALKLPDLSYRLLLTLVEHAPEAMNREEIIKSVWQGRVVSDESLKQRVTRLRGVIGDKSDVPLYIAAVRGIGYRLIAPIERFDNPPALIETSTQKHSRLNKKHALLISLCSLLLMTIGWAINNNNSQTTPLSSAQLNAQLNAQDYTNQAFTYYARYNPRDNDTAATLYRKAIAADPNYHLAYSGLANVHAQGYLQFGQGYDWTEKSIELAQKAMTLSQTSASAHKAMGLALLAQGKFTQAIAANKISAKLNPLWAAPVNNNASILQQKGSLVEAYQTNIEAIQIEVKDPIPYVHLGNTFRDMVMPEHALKAYQQGMLLKPDYLLAQNDLAKFYSNQQQYDKSLAIINQLLASDPANSRALYNGGLSHMMLGQRTQAIAFFERASVSMGSRYPLHARVRLAILQNDAALLDSARVAVEKTINQGDEWSSYAYLLSLVHLHQGQDKQALSAFQQAVSSGFSDYRLAQKDLMLSALQTHPDFILLVNQISVRVAGMREQVIKLESIRAAKR
ncbi:MAG: winged helix-turn-helix domain-containing protein [Psychrosphaera sp.]|nr:winged helix-turn-helix domain-containing protein [Psychrosphaera sp.]